MHLTSCPLDPALSGWRKLARMGWPGGSRVFWMHHCVMEWRLLLMKWQWCGHFLKKATLDFGVSNNFWPITNTPPLRKMMENNVLEQLLVFLDNTDNLDPLQSGFKPGSGTESALGSLMIFVKGTGCAWPCYSYLIFQWLLKALARVSSWIDWSGLSEGPYCSDFVPTCAFWVYKGALEKCCFAS